MDARGKPVTRRTKAVPRTHGLSATPALLAAGIAVVAMALLFVESRGASAVASTLYVNKGASNCSDSGSGTQGQPYCTIKKAATVAVAGQTVLVSSGTYGGDVLVSNSGTSSARIVFQEASGASVIVSGGTNGFKISGKSYITIKGFTVKQSTGIGIYVKTASNIITFDSNDVSFAGQRTSGNTNPGIRLDNTTNSLVTGNVSHDNSDHGIHLVGGATGNEIANNVSYNNARGVSRAAEGIFLHIGAVELDPQQHHPRQRGLGHRALEQLEQQQRVQQRRLQERRPRHRHSSPRPARRSSRTPSTRTSTPASSCRPTPGPTSQQQHQRRQRHQQPPHQGQHQSGRLGVGRPDDDGLQRRLSERRQRPDRLCRRQVHDARGVPGGEGQGAPRQAGRPEVHQLRVGRLPPPHQLAGDRLGQLGAAGQPAADFDGRARVDDPLTTNTGVGPRTYDDRGAFEYAAQWRSSAGGGQRHRDDTEEHRSDRHRAGQRQRPRQRPADGHRRLGPGARHRGGERQQHRHLHPGGQLLRARLLHLHHQRRPGRHRDGDGVDHRDLRQRRAGGDRAVGVARRGHHEHRHPHRHRRRQRPAALQGHVAARQRQALRRHRHRRPPHRGGRPALRADGHVQQGHLPAQRQLLRLRLVPVQGQRRPGRLHRGGDGVDHRHRRQRSAGGDRAVGDAQPGHDEHGHPHRHRRRQRPAALQGHVAAGQRQALRRHRHRRPPHRGGRPALRADGHLRQGHLPAQRRLLRARLVPVQGQRRSGRLHRGGDGVDHRHPRQPAPRRRARSRCRSTRTPPAPSP